MNKVDLSCIWNIVLKYILSHQIVETNIKTEYILCKGAFNLYLLVHVMPKVAFKFCNGINCNMTTNVSGLKNGRKQSDQHLSISTHECNRFEFVEPNFFVS